jgi:hypothetical protein
MKRHKLLIPALLLLTTTVFAQETGSRFRFYGSIRNDFYYQNRQAQESSEGFVMLFPKDKQIDETGKDINRASSANLFNYHTVVGLEVTGPKWGKVQTSGQFDIDFRGSLNGSGGIFRLRNVVMRLRWGYHWLSIGQLGHDLGHSLYNETVSLNVGAPYQPTGRVPMIKYQYDDPHVKLSFALNWQAQVGSIGPNGRSREYLRNSGIPEMSLKAEAHNAEGSLVGTVIHFASICPRLTSDEGYKVNERVSAFNFQLYGRYRKGLFTFAGKTMLNQNYTQSNTLGGYGVTKKDPVTGEQKYAPLRIWQSWANVMYGRKWRGGVFGGYIKNFGASKPVTGLIGTGTNIDQMFTLSAMLTYNIPNWRFGFEYSLTEAFYGTNDAYGKVRNTHAVVNHRPYAMVMFSF